jgi:DNA-nicking Smr family endonuclease
MNDKNDNNKKKKAPSSPFEALKPLRDAMKQEEERAKESAAKGSKRTPSVVKPQRSAPKASPDCPEDEALLLHRMFAGVEPLDRSRGRIARQAIEPSERVKRAARRGAEKVQAESEVVREHLRTLVDGRFEVGDDGTRVEGRRVDVGVDIIRKLRRGQYAIDGRLDLHGMTVAEARAQLELFLRTMRARGERCVLVIHGKGEHSPRSAGVLRGEISAWLSQGGASEQVAAFATAQGPDGGEGAVYILLRR